jgi:hypothetical protein
VTTVFNEPSNDEPAFGDEEASRPDEIRLCDVPIFRNARVGWTSEPLKCHDTQTYNAKRLA